MKMMMMMMMVMVMDEDDDEDGGWRLDDDGGGVGGDGVGDDDGDQYAIPANAQVTKKTPRGRSRGLSTPSTRPKSRALHAFGVSQSLMAGWHSGMARFRRARPTPLLRGPGGVSLARQKPRSRGRGRQSRENRVELLAGQTLTVEGASREGQ